MKHLRSSLVEVKARMTSLQHPKTKNLPMIRLTIKEDRARGPVQVPRRMAYRLETTVI